MFSRVKSFVRNHWKKVIIGGITVKLVSYGVRYAANQLLQYQEAQAQDVWAKLKKEQHFESTEETFITTYLSLLPKLQETIVKNLDAESQKLLLRNKSTPNKLEVWEELKIIAFSRIIVTIYSTSILNVLLRIQLNVIGGYLFLESGPDGRNREHEWTNVNNAIITNTTAIDTDLQEKYLYLANYFVQGGLTKLCAVVYEKTKRIVRGVSLKQKLTINSLEQVFWMVINEIKVEPMLTSRITNASMHPVKYAWKYIFPQNVLDQFNNFQNEIRFKPHYEPPDMFEHLMNETFDLLDSDDVQGVLKAFEARGISHFMDRVADTISKSSPPSQSMTSSILEDCDGGSESTDTLMNPLPSTSTDSSTAPRQILNESSTPLAKIIPVMNSFVDTCLTSSDPWIILLATSDNVRVLGANVYESFSSTLPN